MPGLRMTEVIELLRRALVEPAQLSAVISRVQTLVWHSDSWSAALSQNSAEILADLAYDLDYYEPSAVSRSEDGAFFDEARALEQIKAVLNQLESDANAG